MARFAEPRFGAVDAAILAIALVAGVATAVLDDRDFMGRLSFHGSKSRPWPAFPAWIGDLELPTKRVHSGFGAALPVLTVGVALAIFRHRESRRLRPRRIPAPGVMATAAAAIALAVELALITKYAAANRVLDRFWSDPARWIVSVLHGSEYLPATVATGIVGAILGVWALLLLGGRWRARAGWRDWLGRWLAWCWLIHNVLAQALFPMIWG